ncbi:MAG: mechanosensitive ion channel family protein [Desulfarculaceae bacterium]|nr:mechanosensitive ion channel family protein [Desulfarculaceae bacterium]MCF8046132.1 mechanosensitive ion channel family protein [Desulfarculaceae bacterium]MCF8064241.1 mechanosensitive ion channel family protein [Desulfarculaceae bacterium]MCF8097183.1 mechanosensitive ion channel family protein [Desulfarculaceae bacterium]MCF8123246.1 mechanosensitive ion channel family protein [Desulfarculaceae bacterium]
MLNAWHWLLAHPYLMGLILIAAAVLSALIVDYLFGRVLKTFVRLSKTELDDNILNNLHGPMRTSVILFAVLVAMDVYFEEQTWQGPLVNIIYSVIIIVWTVYLVRMSRMVFRTLKERHRKDQAPRQLLPLLDNLIMLLLLVHGGYWLFKIWDINVTPLLASAGIATAAVALASKDTLANLFGGVSVLVDHPFRLGDYITLSDGQRGEVVDIGIRSTRILTRDSVLITVPNSIMSTTIVTNESGRVPRFRVRVTVGVGYDSDPEQVEAILLKACEGISEILPSPKARARFREFGDSALVYQLLAWIHDPGDRGRIIHELNTKILKLFREEGIEIPFPQRVISYHPSEGHLRVKVEGDKPS